MKVCTIEGALKNVPNAPSITSRDRVWKGLTIDVHPAIAQMDLECPARDHHVLFYMLSDSAPTIQKRAGKTHISILVPGSVVLMPAGYESTWHGGGPASAKIRIPVNTIDSAAAEIGIGAARARELINVFDTRDPIVETLAGLMCSELADEPNPAQHLLIQSTSCALAAHLLRRYDTSGVKFSRAPSKLDPRALQRILAYINDHLADPIELSALARIANVSKFHFTVLFKRSTGVSSMFYVEQSRIKQAQAMIKVGRMSLADIARAIGYSDQSHFIRRFTRHTGCTPGAYAHRFAARRLPRPEKPNTN